MTADALALFDTAEASPPRPEKVCPACGGPNARRHPRDPRCERCARAGIEAPSLLGLGAGTITVAAELEPEPTPREAHRAHCDGVMMAPIFGIGRTSCGLCDWSPTD